MKHIGIYLTEHKRRLGREHAHLSLFSPTREKGLSEWGSFNTIRGDRVDSYPVHAPMRAIVTKEPHHVLRIAYPRTQHYELAQ